MEDFFLIFTNRHGNSIGVAKKDPTGFITTGPLPVTYTTHDRDVRGPIYGFSKKVKNSPDLNFIPLSSGGCQLNFKSTKFNLVKIMLPSAVSETHLRKSYPNMSGQKTFWKKAVVMYGHKKVPNCLTGTSAVSYRADIILN